MNEREFIWWLLGFIYNKDGLEEFEMDIIRDKIDKIVLKEEINDLQINLVEE